eukprot:878436_1
MGGSHFVLVYIKQNGLILTAEHISPSMIHLPRTLLCICPQCNVGTCSTKKKRPTGMMGICWQSDVGSISIYASCTRVFNAVSPDLTADGSTSKVKSRPVAEAIVVFVLPTDPIDPVSCHSGTGV